MVFVQGSHGIRMVFVWCSYGTTFRLGVLRGSRGKAAELTKSQAYIASRGFLGIKYFHTTWVFSNRGFWDDPVLLRPQSTQAHWNMSIIKQFRPVKASCHFEYKELATEKDRSGKKTN